MLSLPTQIPEGLQRALENERPDFVVKAKRGAMLKRSLVLLGFGLIWLLFTSVFAVAIFHPLITGGTAKITINNVPVIIGPGNYGPLFIPGMIVGLFIAIGLIITIISIAMLMYKGAWFAGTPTRLVEWRTKKNIIRNWEQFSGNMEVYGTDVKGSITFEMRTGSERQRKNGPPRYVPDTFDMAGITNAQEVASLCRKRIQEHDPTPPVTAQQVQSTGITQ